MNWHRREESYSFVIFCFVLFLTFFMSKKTLTILYWVSTLLLAAFILPGVFFLNSEIAVEGMQHMQAPTWLAQLVGYGQPLGILLILFLPASRSRVKEWAYVALWIVYVSAFYAHIVIDWVVAESFMPLVTLALLVCSYVCWHKLK